MARDIALQVVHASDREVEDERAARVIDVLMGAGAYAGIGSPKEGKTSLYRELFGDAYVGRPRADEDPPVASYPSGDGRVTATARRRALRVLRHAYREEFEILMAYEVYYLMAHRDEIPSA